LGAPLFNSKIGFLGIIPGSVIVVAQRHPESIRKEAIYMTKKRKKSL
jgi:hypothetical protein